MSTALQLHTETMADWQIMRQQAEALVKSSFLPKDVKTPEQAMAIILMGRELGIGIMQAFNSINVIAGKPTISPQLMLALINRTGHLEDMLISDDGQCCAVTMRRKGRQPHSEAFSMKDAALMKTTEYINGEKKTISLSEKYNWRQQPAVMRKWRAVAACARVVFPDVIMGLYTPEELGAEVDSEGEVITLPDEEGAGLVWPENKKRVLGAVTPIDAEPEPVKTVRLEGAQPTREPSGKLPSLKGYAGQITALANTLGWDEGYLRVEIGKACSVELFGSLADALPALSQADAKKMIQILRSELEARNK